MEIYVSEMKPGQLPRLPKEEWKETKPHSVTLTVIEDGKGDKKVPMTIKGGIYLEDILRWCKCGENCVHGDYVVEEDGTHGVLCAVCGGVIQLG